MSMDAEFLAVAQRYLDPYQFSSGTESTAILLYGLVKLHRPRTVLEYGSGYSTLFVLRALADNMEDVEKEHQQLIEKTNKTKILERLLEVQRGAAADASFTKMLGAWFASAGRACAANPEFYTKPYQPRVYSLHTCAVTEQRSAAVSAAARVLGVEHLFERVATAEARKTSISETTWPIDLAWCARGDYREFFTEFWNCLSPSGGLMVFHDVPGQPDLYEHVQWMKEQRRLLGDLQLLILQEPHKLARNGCAILRRYSSYRPIYTYLTPGRFAQLARNLRLSISR